MSYRQRHAWSVQQSEAIALQRELAKRVVREARLDEMQHIAGVDMAINEENGMARAAVVLLTYPALEVVEQHVYEEPVRMPYIPGLLSFRETPFILGALAPLKQQPELVLVDGQGIARPRRFGIASHLGLWLELPTIGCAKSILRGEFVRAALGEVVGSWVQLIEQNEVIGAELRCRTLTYPIFIYLGVRDRLET